MRFRTDLLVVLVLNLASGACWAGITPAFQKTDETAHFAYVQALAELGHPPRQFVDTGLLSKELTCWYNGLEVTRYRFFTEERPPWAAQVRNSLDHACKGLSPRYDGAMYHAFQPPAYYLLAAGGYKLASGFSLPTRLLFARMVSVILIAIAVMLTYLMVLEVVPGSRWAARAGALALALQPILMFNESGVNPDALDVTIMAAIALVTARAWRRGLSTSSALAFGALTGVGVLSKVNFLTLLPSIALLAVALWWAGDPAQRLLRAKRLAFGGAIALGLFALYALINHSLWHRGLTYRQATLNSHGGGSIHRLADFSWQFFLPRLPGTQPLFPGYLPLWHDLLEGITTRLGWWNDYGFDGWAPVLMAVGVALAIAAACYVWPRARRRPWPALIAAGAALLFLASLVIADYQYSLANGDEFEGRYIIAAMPLWGLLVGCAVAAVRPRWRGVVTGLLAALFLAHAVIALTTTINRFYL